jgi:hypothetical protein
MSEIISEIISEVQYTVKIKAPTDKRIRDFMSAIEELACRYGDVSVETVHVNPKLVKAISTNRLSKIEVPEASI